MCRATTPDAALTSSPPCPGPRAGTAHGLRSTRRASRRRQRSRESSCTAPNQHGRPPSARAIGHDGRIASRRCPQHAPSRRQPPCSAGRGRQGYRASTSARDARSSCGAPRARRARARRPRATASAGHTARPLALVGRVALHSHRHAVACPVGRRASGRCGTRHACSSDDPAPSPATGIVTMPTSAALRGFGRGLSRAACGHRRRAFRHGREAAVFDVLSCHLAEDALARAGGGGWCRTPSGISSRRPKWHALFKDLQAPWRVRASSPSLQYTLADRGYRFPEVRCRPARPQARAPPASRARRARALPALSRPGPRADRPRARPNRAARLLRLLPDRLGHRRFCRSTTFWCRDGGARPIAPSVQPRHYRRRSVGMDLLFERFLSEERGDGPTSISTCRAATGASASSSTSIERYGRHGAAMTANVITYRGRSAAREVGKVLSLDEV